TIINAYGPTETTICATSMNYSSQKPKGEIVSIGAPLSNNQVVLLDASDHVVPPGIPGEICISGDGVSRGYLNNPQLTAETFTPHPCYKEKRMYHSGDLGRWLPGGVIRFIGRRDQQVKVRGYRIELGEIESRLLSHPDVKQAIVLARDDEGMGKYLCAYVVPVADEIVPELELHKYLAGDLPAYMVPDYFIQLPEIPLNSSGKVDRRALPEPEPAAGGDRYIAPGNDMERRLVQIWSAVLTVPGERIGTASDFFQLGGDSLKAISLISNIHKEFNISLPLKEFFEFPTIADVARYISGAEVREFRPLEPVETKEYYPLSSAQKRLYFIQMLDQSSTGYNMPQVMQLTGNPDPDKLEECLSKLVRKHESLRTSFFMKESEPVQRVHDEVEFRIEFFGRGEPLCSPLNGNRSGSRNNWGSRNDSGSHGGLPLQPLRDFVRPFDLSRTPLIRSALIRHGDGGFTWMLDTHHIIFDGISMGVLVKEFMTL
ncbi:MAG: AMP-binding protein, partial [bacterium]|nr:AMP-binding protein [bacterium]